MNRNILLLSIGLNIMLAAAAGYFFTQHLHAQKTVNEFEEKTTYVVKRAGESVDDLIKVEKEIIAASPEEKAVRLADFAYVKSAFLRHMMSVTDLVEQIDGLDDEEYIAVSFQIAEALHAFESASDDKSRQAAAQSLEKVQENHRQFEQTADAFLEKLNR